MESESEEGGEACEVRVRGSWGPAEEDSDMYIESKMLVFS